VYTPGVAISARKRPVRVAGADGDQDDERGLGEFVR
jgi:hypothetical protein